MKLGFDIDGVVCDLFGALDSYIKDKYGVEWFKEDYSRYSLLDVCAASGIPTIDTDIAKDAYNKARDAEFRLSAPPFTDAIEALRRYVKIGHTIHFISARSGDTAKYNTVKWLRHHKVPFNSIHTNIGSTGCEAKGKLGRTLNLDMYVDDLTTHLESMWKYKKRWRKGLLLFDRPWNQEAYDASKFTKVYSWADIDRQLGIQNR